MPAVYKTLGIPLTHPRAQKCGSKVRRYSGKIAEHILKACNALGRPLDRRHPVHHVDLNPRNNENSNLVICESKRYHHILHARTRVLRAGGDPNTDKICCKCKFVLNKSEFTKRARGTWDGLSPRCRECERQKHALYYYQSRSALIEELNALSERMDARLQEESNG